MLHGAVPADASALSLAGVYNNPSQGSSIATPGTWGDLSDGPDQVVVTTTGEKLLVLCHATLRELGSGGPSDAIGMRLACVNGSTVIPNDANNSGGVLSSYTHINGDWVFWSGGGFITNAPSGYVGYNEAIGVPLLLDGLGSGTWTIKLQYAFNVNGGSYSGLTAKRRRLFVWRWGY